MKIVAVTQSNYIPWKGYFDIIQVCDEVIFLDDVQYTRRDWRNRNQIQTPQGLKWLTIPVDVKGKHANLRICEVQISDGNWAEKHWNLIQQNYKQAPYFEEVKQLLQPLYEQAEKILHLSEINYLFIKEISAYLGFKTNFSKSYEHFSFEELDKMSSTQRLMQICKKQSASDYISGPSAKSYMVQEVFDENNIKIHWAKYEDYPIYDQLHGNFSHHVSIVDLLMMEGPQSLNKLKGEAIFS